MEPRARWSHSHHTDSAHVEDFIRGKGKKRAEKRRERREKEMGKKGERTCRLNLVQTERKPPFMRGCSTSAGRPRSNERKT